MFQLQVRLQSLRHLPGRRGILTKGHLFKLTTRFRGLQGILNYHQSPNKDKLAVEVPNAPLRREYFGGVKSSSVMHLEYLGPVFAKILQILLHQAK